MLARRLLCALALALFAAPAAPAADLDPFLPPDTESYLSVNVRQIIDSPLFQKQLLAPAKQMLLEAGGESLQDVLKDLGVDPFKNIDRITIASPGGIETDRGLIIVHGSFDADKFKTKGDDAARNNGDTLKLHKANLGGGASHLIYEFVLPQQDSSLFAALASNKTLIFSPGKDYVLDALKQARARQKPELKNKEFAALLARLDDRQSVSLAVLGKSLDHAENDLIPKFLAEAFGGVEALGGGLTVKDDIKLELLLASKDGESASRMHKALDKGVKLVIVGLSLLGEERKEWTFLLEVVKSIRVSNKGKVVSVSARLTQDLIEDFFKKND